MVQVVMLHIPCLWKHPVEPVHSAAAQRAKSKAHRRETARSIVLLVVPAMASMAVTHCQAFTRTPQRDSVDARAHEGPVKRNTPGCSPECQAHDGDDVWLHPHGSESNSTTDVGPEDHLLQVLDICLTLSLLEAVAQRAALGTECIQVDLCDPLILRRHRLHSARLEGGRGERSGATGRAQRGRPDERGGAHAECRAARGERAQRQQTQRVGRVGHEQATTIDQLLTDAEKMFLVAGVGPDTHGGWLTKRGISVDTYDFEGGQRRESRRASSKNYGGKLE
eukprot:scaffold18907_cov33-Tisochrysis_lutea.AAC.3